LAGIFVKRGHTKVGGGDRLRATVISAKKRSHQGKITPVSLKKKREETTSGSEKRGRGYLRGAFGQAAKRRKGMEGGVQGTQKWVLTVRSKNKKQRKNVLQGKGSSANGGKGGIVRGTAQFRNTVPGWGNANRGAGKQLVGKLIGWGKWLGRGGGKRR